MTDTATALDTRRCVTAGTHRPCSRHRRADCPTIAPQEPHMPTSTDDAAPVVRWGHAARVAHLGIIPTEPGGRVALDWQRLDHALALLTLLPGHSAMVDGTWEEWEADPAPGASLHIAVALADEDTPTDDAADALAQVRAILAAHVAPHGGRLTDHTVTSDPFEWSEDEAVVVTHAHGVYAYGTSQRHALTGRD